MRTFAFLAAAAALTVAPYAAAQTKAAEAALPAPISEEALKLGREIIVNGFPVDSRRKMFEGVMVNLMAQLRAAQGDATKDPGANAIVDKNLAVMREQLLDIVDQHSPELFESFARAYARAFPIEELRAIRDFSATPAGQHFISRGGSLMADPDVAAANKAYMSDAFAAMPKFTERLKADLAEYYAFKKRPGT